MKTANRVEIFNEEYDGESIVDLQRDIAEALDSRFNDVMKVIPKDEHGFTEVVYNVIITWKE